MSASAVYDFLETTQYGLSSGLPIDNGVVYK
jgi:hypothetical protein